MDSNSREVLKLFVEKAEKLFNMQFTRRIVEQQGILQRRSGDNGPWRMSIGDEERDAFIATLRMFIQKKDRISFYSIATLLNDQCLSSAWKDEFRQARTTVDQIFDGHLPHLNIDGQPLMRRDIWEIIVHGDLAHVDAKKRLILDRWYSDPDLFAQIEFEFFTMIAFILDQIGKVAVASRHELERNSD